MSSANVKAIWGGPDSRMDWIRAIFKRICGFLSIQISLGKQLPSRFHGVVEVRWPLSWKLNELCTVEVERFVTYSHGRMMIGVMWKDLFNRPNRSWYQCCRMEDQSNGPTGTVLRWLDMGSAARNWYHNLGHWFGVPTHWVILEVDWFAWVVHVIVPTYFRNRGN